MIPRRRLLAAPLVVLFAGTAALTEPPPTRKEATVDRVHGVDILDPYRWLEDQDAPDTRAWIEAQNKYTDAVIGPLPGEARIEKRLTELMKIETIGVPVVRGGRYFYTKRRADQDLSVIYLRSNRESAEEILVDPHPLSADHSTSVGIMNVSPDGSALVYGVRAGGEDEVTVRVMDVETRKELPDALPRARYSGVSITRDRQLLYYSRQTPAGPRVFVHRMGADPASDKEIFGEGYGREKIIRAALSDDGRFLIVTVLHGSAASKTEVYVADMDKRGPLVPIVTDIDATFDPTIAGRTLYLRTNWNAPKQRVMAVELDRPARPYWREAIPQASAVITDLSAVGGRLFASYLENVQTRIRSFAPDGTAAGELTTPGVGVTGNVSGEWERDEGFFTFSSLSTPQTIYRYIVSSGGRDVWARQQVPVSGDSVEIKQFWFASKDRTKVPMFVAHRKGLKLDGSNPALLTGYGGFNVSQTPGFSARAAFWIENGGVFALPSLRGGGEFGEEWHRAGMLDRKQTVFDDFVGAAEWLVKNGYTSPARLAISGGSNGGLLVGAALTQRPELFQAVVCSYPLLDMVRYHKFLVAGYWVPEYGSADDPDQFKYLFAYSPYHRVTKGVKYPAVLFITGDADTRVAPLHARKMTALLQDQTGSPQAERPILLKYDTKAGHSGGIPLGRLIERLTDEMRFLFWQLGIVEKGTESAGDGRDLGAHPGGFVRLPQRVVDGH
ncbi:MAG TPA: prolyl oligopeptidase family serine peptidase [Vicinamibacterales bacterium]|nr:prolyl oligopeptidase family serine peptidase [Vicinamibacterales bacterium]